MSCNITNNVYSTLLKEGIIDSNHNIIADIGVFETMRNSINQKIREEYGPIAGINFLDTQIIKSRFGRKADVKILFNPQYEKHIEGVQNQTNKIYSYIKPGENLKSSEVLKKISQDKDNPLAELAGKLIPLAKKNDVNISMRQPHEMNEGSAQGTYRDNTNDIVVSTGTVDKMANKVLVHEIIHSLTANEIDNNKNSKLVKDLEKLYEDTLWLTDKKGLYGYSTVHEFAVAVLTDPKVIRDMRGMPKSGNVNTSGNNLLEQIINKLLEIIGLKNMNDNILKQAVQTVTDIMQDNSLYLNDSVVLTDAQEQDYWDSVQSHYDDMYVDDSDLNPDTPYQGTFDFDEPLNAPVPVSNNNMPIQTYSDSFAEWYKTREKTLENLRRVHDYYFKLDKKNPILEQVNIAIEEIEHQMESIDLDDPYIIFDSAVAEAEVLALLLEKAKDNPEQSLDIMETNDLEKRIRDLNYYFLGRDPDTDTSYDVDTQDSRFYKDYMDEFGQYSPDKMQEIRNMVQNLNSDFKNIKKNLVVAALKSNSFVKEHLRTGNLTQDKIDDMIKKINRGELDVDEVGSYTLGLASGGGILGQLLSLRRTEAGDREKAFVANKLAPLTELWNQIKEKKSGGKFLIDHLYQIDKYGVKMGRLISKFTDEFSTTTQQIAAEKSRFEATKDSRDYEIWMKAEKANYERIDIRMFPSIYNKYAADPRFEKDFPVLTPQQMQDYEDTLKSVLGPVMYEIEKQKAEELVEDFVHGFETGILTPLQKTTKNPFAFLRNFETNDYYKMDSKTGRFLEPTYTRFIPKHAHYYNSSFDVIENTPELSEYYKGAYDIITNYTNPTFQSEGVNVGLLDLETFEDLLERNAYQEMSMLGKVHATAKALYRNRVQRYADDSLARLDERLSDKNHDRQKLVVAYSNSINNRIQKIKSTYAVLDPNIIIQRAQDKLGVTVSIDTITRRNKDGDLIRLPEFYNLAESLARHELNKITSTNIQESLHNSAYLAADTRAKRSVIAMLEAFKDIANTATVVRGESSETKKFTNIGKMIHSWGQSNIYGEKFSGNMQNKGKGTLTRLAVAKIFGMKVYSGADKITLKEIREILKVTPAGDIKDFEFKGVQYRATKSPLKFHKMTDPTVGYQEISIEEFKKAYESMLTDTVGTRVTIGSALLGYMNNLREMQLGLSPRAGIKNRIAGMGQTMAVAASKRYGFDLNQYHASRRFLRGINTRNYVSKLWEINENNPKYTQVRMLEDLISRLELQQNRADELAMEAKFGSTAGSQKIESLKNFLMDFAMNNPEKHNQLEIAVAIMMNTNIKDINGKDFKIFDEKKLEFTIYKPGTLELKDEFRNERNETMWEKFQTYTDPSTGEQLSESIAMTTKIRTTIEQTQGNYNNDDMIMLQNTVHGKLGTMYTRYMYENTNLQFGRHYVDLRTGEMNIKGRKINLLEHAPTTMVYVSSNFLIPIVGGSFAFVAGSPFLAAGFGIAAVFGLGLLIHSKAFKAKSLTSLKEYKLAKDFALETLMLMGKTPLNNFSYGKVNPKAIDNTIDRLQSKTYGGMISEQDRLLLSECAQELATKFTNYIMYTVMALVSKFLYTALLGGDDEDDDDTYVQRKIRELVNIENTVNSLLNDRNQVMGDINRYLSPGAFYNDATAFAFFRSLARDFNTTKKVLTGDYEDKDWSELIYDVSKMGWIPGANIIPNNAKKAVVGLSNGDMGVFSDNRVYEGKDVVDKALGKAMKKGEDFYKAEARSRRANIKEEATAFFKKQIRDEELELSPKDYRAELKSRVDAFMNDVDKSKDQTYQDLVESGAFDAKQEELKALKEQQ